jgi:hypothetical protein
LDNYRRYAIPARNNYLSSLFPGELYQGWAQYFYDGYAWVGDSPNDPQISPEYSWHLSPTRPQDIDWSLNWVRIHLADQGQRGELDVDLETLTPNLERLEISAGGAGDATWKATPPRFKWKLEQGQNVLSARSVNCFGRTGVPSRVEVRWTPMIHENNSSSSASRSSSR